MKNFLRNLFVTTIMTGAALSANAEKIETKSKSAYEYQETDPEAVQEYLKTSPEKIQKLEMALLKRAEQVAMVGGQKTVDLGGGCRAVITYVDDTATTISLYGAQKGVVVIDGLDGNGIDGKPDAVKFVGSHGEHQGGYTFHESQDESGTITVIVDGITDDGVPPEDDKLTVRFPEGDSSSEVADIRTKFEGVLAGK